MYEGGSTDAKVFSEVLRVQIFNEVRYHWSKGDWWLQLNIDEFYVGNSKAFCSVYPGDRTLSGNHGGIRSTDEAVGSMIFPAFREG